MLFLLSKYKKIVGLAPKGRPDPNQSIEFRRRCSENLLPVNQCGVGDTRLLIKIVSDTKVGIII